MHTMKVHWAPDQYSCNAAAKRNATSCVRAQVVNESEGGGGVLEMNIEMKM